MSIEHDPLCLCERCRPAKAAPKRRSSYQRSIAPAPPRSEPERINCPWCNYFGHRCARHAGT